ncbi:cell division protein FtsZ [Rubrimonas cliftonensis]|uniref:Cell division protein FtsZ n=1 Tax=Rubrimonas cliftonensis TaxID=89524 RepID=A0A1H4B624_9RHOB|nr:cell division protein FtsZ [Rubrimonas cliftonensis]SEA43735.1 cell division protein FtsZ [Rubrimonas cliftonensis]
MALNLKSPEAHDLRPRITVFGVGGAGGNAVNNMIQKQLEGAEFVVANTDAQALAQNSAPRQLQLGANVTQGLGAGAKPGVGAQAAEESLEEIVDHLAGSHMCFITAGMGGGTGTGAAPVIARAAREMGILTVGVVTKPFHFEGTKRMNQAEGGIAELQQVVDTLIIIPNQNLFRIANERTTFAEAFMMADDVLYQGVKGVTDLMVRPGLINLDFADVRSVMDEMGKAMMGTGEASGETRAIDAAEKAIANPLLDEVSLKGARGVLINITGGYDLTLFELDEAANRIRAEVDPEANIIVGSTLDPEMTEVMRVSVVATGIDAAMAQAQRPEAGESRVEGRREMREAPRPAAAAHQAPQPMAQPAPPPAPQPAMAREPVERSAPRREADRQRQDEAAARIASANLFSLDRDEDDGAVAPDALFDLDDGSLARPALAAAEPARDHPFVPGAQESRAEMRPVQRPQAVRAAAPAHQQRQAADAEDRPARFGFNNLITRMTGAAARDKEQPSFVPRPGAVRREPEAAPTQHPHDDEDARMEVPAFLRRQAN